MTVDEAQDRITSREFSEWQAYHQVEPFGQLRDDFRMGILAATVVNLFKSETDEPAKPTDFLPEFVTEAAGEEPAPADSDAEFIAAMKAAFPIAEG
jgi:hypothetical protein